MTTLETMYAPQVNSPATTLSANISSSATSISVLNGSILPAAPNLLVIGGDTDNAETVLMTAKSGNTLTVVRGVQGTAKSWSTGALIARLFTAKDLSDVQTNITALNSGKAEQTDLAAAEDRIDDVYASTASGSIATFYRTVGGLPVDDLTIDINPVQAGTGDPSPSNVRAISGWTGATVTVGSQNLVPADVHWNAGYRNNTGTAGTDATFQYTDPIAVKASTNYVLLRSGSAYRVYYLAADGTWIERTGSLSAKTYAFTTPANCGYVQIQTLTASEVSQLTLVEKINDLSVSWSSAAGTVYKGSLNVTTGELTVTYKSVDMGSLSWSSSSSGTHPFFFADISDGQHQPAGVHDVEFWCSAYKALPQTMNGTNMGNNAADHDIVVNQRGESYALRIFCRDDTYGTDAAAFTTAVTGQTVVYPLETPVTYQLTPTQVTSLLGENNIWADTGDVSVTFGADIKSYIDDSVDGKQDEITASGILKGDGEGGVSAAVAGTDYQAPLTAGMDYQTPLAENALQYYGVCSTSASTQAKTVSITGITSLTTGLEIRVKMTNAQTYNGTPKLNVNSLGAKDIMQHGSVAAVRYQWQAGEVVSLTYDGTYWVLENNSLATTTYFGLTRLSSATNSTAEDSAATPKAVKTAYDLANAAVPATEKGTSVATLAAVGDSTTPTVPRLTPAQGFAPIFEIDSDTTLAAKHAGGILVCTNSPTITIPASVFDAATEIEILNYGTGVVTVAGASGVSLNGASAGSVTVPDQYHSGVLLAISASQWVIQGAIK